MDNIQPLVSICCITYNHASYIRQCLDGFLMQKVTFPIEIIINDDCSTDGTTDVIREYEAKYPDLIKPIYHAENEYSKGVRGMFATFVFPRAKGKYIALCEGDDYWIDSLKLQKQVDFMEANPDYSLCFHNAVEFYEGVSKVPRIFCNIAESREVTLEEIVDSWIVPTASMLFRSTVIENYPEWTRQIYSGDLTMQLIAYSKGKLYYMNRIMSFYRKAFDNKNSVSVGLADRADFVFAQQALLLRFYNEHTKYMYSSVLNRRIIYKEKESEFMKFRRISMFYAFVRMPFFFIQKLFRRLFR